MRAEYIGKNQYMYQAVGCRPVSFVQGMIYDIEVRPENNRVIVEVYNDFGLLISWIPYTDCYEDYWRFLPDG